MKLLGRVLTGCLLIGLLILGWYVVRAYLLPLWVPILFYSYAVLGAVTLTYGTTKAIAETRKAHRDNSAAASLKQVFKKSDLRTRITYARDYLAVLASIAAYAVVWPVDAVWGMKLGFAKKSKPMSAEEMAIYKQATLSQHNYSLVALFITLVVVGLTYKGVALRVYGILVLYAMVANVMLRHVQYFAGTTSLPAILRRVSSNPYFLFLLIAIADFTTLVLSLTALTALNSSTPHYKITFADVTATAKQVLHAQDTLHSILKGMRPALHEVLITAAGLAYAAALTKAIMQFGEFKRKDEDYVWLASVEIRLGNFALALRHLRSVNSWDATARALEIAALLGVNEIEQAEKRTWAFMESTKSDPSVEIMFGNILQLCILYPIPEGVRISLLRRAIELHVEDTFLQDCVSAMVATPKAQREAYKALSAYAKDYPLSVGTLAYWSEKPDEAISLLTQATCPSALGEIVRLNLVLASKLRRPETSREEDVETIKDHTALLIPKVRELAKQAAKPWERVVLFEEIQKMLSWNQACESDRVQELTFLADRVKTETKGEDAERGFRFLELQLTQKAPSS